MYNATLGSTCVALNHFDILSYACLWYLFIMQLRNGQGNYGYIDRQGNFINKYNSFFILFLML